MTEKFDASIKLCHMGSSKLAAENFSEILDYRMDSVNLLELLQSNRWEASDLYISGGMLLVRATVCGQNAVSVESQTTSRTGTCALVTEPGKLTYGEQAFEKSVGMISIPLDVGAMILDNLTLEDWIAIRLLSRETCAWLQSCLPAVRRVSWRSKCSRHMIEHIIDNLFAKHNMTRVDALQGSFEFSREVPPPFSYVFRCFANLGSFSVTNSPCVTDCSVAALARCCPKLQRFNVYGFSLLFKNCNQLKELRISGSLVTDDALKFLSHAVSQTIALSWSTSIFPLAYTYQIQLSCY
ncbi:hypothetical protein CYMTET_15821 [Cymbomonas tetramitiformis]|uniref:F-box domain-containing protein n=1 Tax=Cymbomonas tetramitiformis TaxID=36881 RepID=A0AAE0GD85_9CHLO|nr:hypothetical protein CYMTET_15821 [Cymbomonas tetramitiformis]